MTGPSLNTELVLEEGQREPDGMGGYRLSWRPLGRLWAALEARSAREAAQGVGMVSVVQWRITVRGAAVGDPRRPRAGQRMSLGTRRFRIEAVAERDPHGRWLDCFAREEEQA